MGGRFKVWRTMLPPTEPSSAREAAVASGKPVVGAAELTEAICAGRGVSGSCADSSDWVGICGRSMRGREAVVTVSRAGFGRASMDASGNKDREAREALRGST